MENKYNVVDSIWFNEVGIVKVLDDVGDAKYYIGKTSPTNATQEEDEQFIAAWGSEISIYIVKHFFEIQ